MVATPIITAYILFFISMACAMNTTTKLYISGKNYLIAVLAGGMVLTELVVLTSIIWIDDFQNNVPRGYCIFQGLALQYSVYLQIVAAVCFSYHIYQLLVCYKQEMTLTLQKIYTWSIICVPIIMTVIAAVASIKTDAIQPLTLNCDIKNPLWVRLIGYSGFNFALTFFGVYLSARAAYQVFRHLGEFKTKLTMAPQISSTTPLAQTQSAPSTEVSDIQISIENNTETITADTTDIDIEPAVTSFGQTQTRVDARQAKAYNMTRSAAIRMVLFAVGFALINIAAAFGTIRTIIHGSFEEPKGSLGGNDLAGAFMGIMVFFVFGLPRSVRKFFSRKGV